MAKKLSVQIALEGAAQIKKDLAEIGDVGVEAWVKIEKAAKDVGGFAKLDPKVVTKELADMGVTGKESVDKIQAAVSKAAGFEKLVAGVKSAEVAIGRLTNAWKIFTRVLAPLGAISAAATGLGKLATAAEDTIVALGTLAARGGTSIAKLDAMRQTFIAAGGSVAEFSKIYETLVGNVDKLKADKVNELTEAMKKMKEAGWGDEAINRWADEQRAIIDRWAPGAKTAGDRFAELGKRLAALRTDTERLGLLQRDGISATLENVNALMKYGAMLGQARDKSRDLTQADLNRALAQQKATTELSNAWQRLMETIGRLAMGSAATNFLAGVVTNFTAGIVIIDKAWQGFVLAFNAGLALIVQAWSATWTAVASVVMPVVQTVSQAWQGFVLAFNAGLATIGAGWNSLWSGLGSIATSVLDMLTGAWNGFTGAISSAAGMIGSAFDSVMGVINSVIEAINNAWQALLNLLGAGQAVGGPAMAAGGLAGHAGGGMIRGRGTGTSDSNLAWVSRGEHIMPARAVRQPGVLAFLEALRRSGGNLSRVLEGMGRFALGGMVPRSVPAFAGGGLVGGMSNVTIQFPGVPEIGGLRAAPSVVEQLRRAAVMAQVRSGGRKPSRYG